MVDITEAQKVAFALGWVGGLCSCLVFQAIQSAEKGMLAQLKLISGDSAMEGKQRSGVPGLERPKITSWNPKLQMPS